MNKLKELTGGGKLIIHDSGVGDFINMTPLIREIRRTYPTKHITLIIYPRALNLAEVCPYVDEVLPNLRPYNWNNFFEDYVWNVGFAKNLLIRKFDVAYIVPAYSSALFLAYMSGAKERISFKVETGLNLIGAFPMNLLTPLLTFQVPKQLYGIHSADNALGLLDYSLHAPIVKRDLELWYTPFDYTIARQFIQENINSDENFYTIVMGGENDAKKWNPENYAELIKMILHSETNSKFVILGGEKDIEAATRLKNNLNEKILEKNIFDLTNKITFRQSLALMSFCNAYIGNDTGTMHAAAAGKTPVLTPNCFATDLNMTNVSAPKTCCPNGVPSVIVSPKHALPECKQSHDRYFGCRVGKPHCINQIKPRTMFEGFKILKKKINKGDTDPFYFD